MAGKDWPIYVNTGTYGSPTWTRMCRVSDVNISQSKSTNDVMMHCSPNKKAVIGYKKHSATFKYVVKKVLPAGVTDTMFDRLQDSYDNDTVIDIAFLNGVIAASTTRQGERGPVIVTKLDRSQADEEAVTYDVEVHEVEDEQAGSVWDWAPYELVTGA